jgi:AcrR family transcriptional regulator
MSGKDGETRLRVLEVATRLFAARGFEKVTVREICREATANVAAVNYHFGDKMGLYLEVLGRAIDEMRRTTEEALGEGVDKSPTEKLRVYVSVFLRRIAGHQDSWIHQLMMHEMADPTEALELVVDRVLRPRQAYLGEVIGEMLSLPPEDDRVKRSVSSVQSQFHALLMSPVARKLSPDLKADTSTIDAWADHIASFSLGGIEALQVPGNDRKRR